MTVKQGDIIKLEFTPQAGHEQAGYRPALVVSNDDYNTLIHGMAIVCPITNTNNGFPMHVALDNRTQTTGVVLCEQVKALDIQSRRYKFIEQAPADIVDEVMDILHGSL